MATQTNNRTIERFLNSLEVMLGDLSEVASEWDSLSEGERIGWSLDWDQMMQAMQTLLDPAYRSGSMTPDESLSYERVLRDLDDAAPLIKRLNLHPSPILARPASR